MGKRIKPVIRPKSINRKINRGSQRKIPNLRKKGKLYDLVLTIAPESGLADLHVLAGGNGAVSMPHNKVMQKELGGDAERKHQQHYSA
ncbi:MAG TPA: hypothetical protein VHE34_05625 [Puia sp.]|uniref:hypothetical protein n=1 Tax=Puia sp. TaxID=2045100 RepID=UPI002BDC52BC|nr:hypothetical protein [Puia sp.]HVU94680.1 hypothetical protein [Puia sp.]